MKIKTFTSGNNRLRVYLFSSGNLVFSGRAININPDEIYNDLYETLKEKVFTTLNITFNFDCINGNNERILLVFLNSLSRLNNILFVKIIWFIDEEDSHMIELANTFKQYIPGIQFSFFFSKLPFLKNKRDGFWDKKFLDFNS